MNKLWYKKPAKFWRQALPIGNGLTGVMVYGGKNKEKLAFNDSTFWSGYPKEQANAKSYKNLDEVRSLIFEGKNAEADKLAMTSLSGGYSESFLPLGDLNFVFKGLPKTSYMRDLNLSNATHTVTNGRLIRKAFVSYPDKIAVYHIENNKPFSMVISAKSQLQSECEVSEKSLFLMGNAADFVVPNYLWGERKPIKYTDNKGMSFCLMAQAETDGLIVTRGSKLNIINATKVTLYMTTATGYLSFDEMPVIDRGIAKQKCINIINNIEKNYEEILVRHIRDYQAIFEKNTLSLYSETDIDTFKIIKQAKKGDVKTGLVELMYNYGKYLTISASRSGGQAMNLQGIWNRSTRPPWSSNYTTNINAEMNYWGAISSNLSDCIEPYINFVYEVMQAGKKTAKVNYNCEGFACNHNVDIWKKTAPVQGSPSYMLEPLCGVWLANELYSHYKNGKLEIYKDKILEILSEAAQFASDYLVEKDGNWVVCPSASPEAEFMAGNKRCSLDYATSFDMALVSQVFQNYKEISNSGKLFDKINIQYPRLYPFKEGSTGILEWHKDYEIVQKGHRHFSPLYGFYPARVIKYYENSDLTDMIEKLFDYRTANSKSYIGWSAAWAICLAGRLHKGEKALDIINSMLSHSVFYNLFDVHPPYYFQIDGNLGFVAGINEMLVYEENGIIELLPALPAVWKKGKMKGLVVNGATISFSWENGKVVDITSDRLINIRNSNLSDKCKIQNVLVK